MKKSFFAQSLLAIALVAGGAASNSGVVECGGPSGIRVTVIDPGLVGGYCYTQTGNFIGDNFTGKGPAGSNLTLIEKDVADANPNGTTTGQLQYSFNEGRTEGTWSFADSLWDAWDRLFLGFHFGGGGNFIGRNPDSFIVELAGRDTSGSWELAFADGWDDGLTDKQIRDIKAQLNGLSNIYLLGVGTPTNVPEPGMLALLALGLAGLGLATRRRKTA